MEIRLPTPLSQSGSKLPEEIRWRNCGHRRTGEITRISRNHKCGPRLLRHRGDDRILKIQNGQSPRPLPPFPLRTRDQKMPQNLIQRPFRIRLRPVFSDEIMKGRQAMCGKNPAKSSRDHQVQHPRRRPKVRLASLEDIQRHIDVNRDGHACFFSQCSRCSCSRASDRMMPVAATTAGCSGCCKRSRRLRACRARKTSTEIPCALV